MKQICTKFGLLYHNTRIWNSKCLIFYQYFAFLLITTCKFAAICHYLSISSTFSLADRIILLAILQTQHALCGFTIVKKCFFTRECSNVPSKFAFFRNPKTKTTSESLRRRFSTAKRGSLKHKMHAQDRTRRSHQNQPFDTKTVSNALARVKVIPDVSRQYSAHLAPCTPRFARNRKYTAAKPPPSPDSTQPETRRHIPAPLRG